MPVASELYPPTVPYDHGLLDVGDGHLVHWETYGNPDGTPVVIVHGGPGSGSTTGAGRNFDPARCRIVVIDQRGCGRSRPHAADPATSLDANTTWHLVGDMEKVREHLGIDRWVVQGGSWGSTLVLAYAQRHPDRVLAIILVAVTTSSRREIDWLYRGVGRVFPEEWERFRAGAGVDERGPGMPRVDLVTTYARLVDDPDDQVRRAAVEAWCRWEDTVLSLEPSPKKNSFSGRPSDARIALVRICSHYFANAAWLDEGQLIRDADTLAGIPGTLVHGRHDLSCPAETAFEVSRRWPGSELFIVDDGGHTGSASFRTRLLAAADRYADIGI